MKHELPLFDREIEELLRTERSAVAPPSGAQGRVASRLASSLGITMAVGGAAKTFSAAEQGSNEGLVEPTRTADPVGTSQGGVDVPSHGFDAQATAVMGADASGAASSLVPTVSANMGASQAAAVGQAAAAASVTHAVAGAATVASGGMLVGMAKSLAAGALALGLAVGGSAVLLDASSGEDSSVEPSDDEASAVLERATTAGPSVNQGGAEARDDGFEVPTSARPEKSSRAASHRASRRKRGRRGPGATDQGAEVASVGSSAPQASSGVVKQASSRTPVRGNRSSASRAEVPSAGKDARRWTRAEEESLLETARIALSRRKPARALTVLTEHRARLTRAVYAEESEALSILALLGLGRVEQARTRATAFRSAYPQSIHLPIVEGALRPARAQNP